MTRIRNLGTGYVSAEHYPTAGGPDWKAEALSKHYGATKAYVETAVQHALDEHAAADKAREAARRHMERADALERRMSLAVAELDRWKSAHGQTAAKNLRLRKELRVAEIQRADLRRQIAGLKAREVSPDAGVGPNPENAPTGQPGPFKAKSKRGRK